MLAAPATYDYHLVAGSPCVDAGSDPGMTSEGVSLMPAMEYVHPAMVEGRMTVGTIDIGAYELGGAVALGDGGAAMDLAVPLGVDGTDGGASGVGAKGCHCDFGGHAPAAPLPIASLLLVVAVALFRSR
jgi:hypothetical protein